MPWNLLLLQGGLSVLALLVRSLVSADILRLVHGGARMIYVGKQAGYHTRTQVHPPLPVLKRVPS